MWIILRLVIGISLLVLIEIYFIKKIGLSTKYLFPSFFKKSYPLVRRVFLIWLNLYPAVLVIVFIYFAITANYVLSPESWIIDYLLIYPFWIMFILMFQAGIYFLLLDLLKFMLLPVYKKHKELTLRIQSVIVFLVVSFFLLYIPIRVIYDYNAISVRIVQYTKPSLPQSLSGFKIAFISDIQTDHYTNELRVNNFINEINSLSPDVVLIAGDFITTGPNHIEQSADLVGKLNANYGVYSCIGDHDNWAYRNDYPRSIKEISTALEKNDVEIVDNSQRIINVDDSIIGVTFITNTYVGTIEQSLLDSLASNSNGNLKIFLTHQPRPYLIEAARKNNYHLFLAGHTHGGQISLVFPFIQLTPTLIETRYVRGNFWFDDMLMIVNRGLGMSLAPIRYNSTPEITLITLNNNE
jgi:predicted MPP superfamily phosphohydrolase